MTMICTNCGKNIEDSFAFCPFCGKEVKQETLNLGRIRCFDIPINLTWELTSNYLKPAGVSEKDRLISAVGSQKEISDSLKNKIGNFVKDKESEGWQLVNPEILKWEEDFLEHVQDIHGSIHDPVVYSSFTTSRVSLSSIEILMRKSQGEISA